MIYFIQDRGCKNIKIGFTKSIKSLKQRFSANQHWFAHGLDILKITDGSIEFEAELHDRFGHLWDKGEWFKPGEELMKHIEETPAVGEISNFCRHDKKLSPGDLWAFLQSAKRSRLDAGSVNLRSMFYGKLQPKEYMEISIGELFVRADKYGFPEDLIADLKQFHAGRDSNEMACKVKYHRLRETWANYRTVEMPLAALIHSHDVIPKPDGSRNFNLRLPNSPQRLRD